MLAIAGTLAANVEPLKRLLTAEQGKPHADAMGDVLGGAYVFPGGKVDREDGDDDMMARIDSVDHALHGALSDPALEIRAAAACYVAAGRETFEEAGLLLAKPAPKRSAMGPWRDFVAQGVQADLDALDYVARAVTPPMVPKRFDARFFMAEADRLVSLERQADCGELDEIAWVDIDEALKLDLPSVTRFVVREVEQRLENPDRPAPFMRMLRGSTKMTAT